MSRPDPGTGGPSHGEVAERLRELGAVLRDIALPLDLPGSGASRERQRTAVAQLDDYVVPRMAALHAPLLAVVGGSTGAGKSTLVNSLVGEEVSPASAIRPTTRRPVLVHHPDDAAWFDGDRILPELARVRAAVPRSTPGAVSTPGAMPGPGGRSDPGGRPWPGGGSGPDVERPPSGRPRPGVERGDAEPIGELAVLASMRVPRGLALLDAPDIDSVVVANRRLAGQLLAAADLWLFVTTAARYADAVPWELLHEAAARRVVVGIVLDRVPPGAAGEVRADLADQLHAQGLARAPLFVVSERPVDERGLLPEPDVAPVRAWLHGLAADAPSRAAVARQTLVGAVEGVLRHGEQVAGAAREQSAAMTVLHDAAVEAYAHAHAQVMAATEDGTLLRGEVLARWQEFVGTGEWFRSMEAAIGRVRDRLSGYFRGRPAPQARAEAALESSLVTLVVAEVEAAAERTRRSWQTLPGGSTALATLPPGAPAEQRPELVAAVGALVRQWQQALLERVRAEGEDRRTKARMLSLGVNASGVTLMLVVFAFSGGITGIEVGVAGGTAVVGQKVLEMVFGDQAVRDLARHARDDLAARVTALLEDRRRPWLGRLAELDVDETGADRLERAVAEVAAVLHGAGMTR